MAKDLNIKGLIIDSSINIDRILDEDDMASNSATALVTQQSIINYVTTYAVITGTPSETFQIDNDNNGVILKNYLGNLLIRNSSDTGYADITCYNLTVNGTQTIINTETLLVEDNIIFLNYGSPDVPIYDSGIAIDRGLETPAILLWNESNNTWTIGLSGSAYEIINSHSQQSLYNKLYGEFANLDAGSISTSGQFTSEITTGTSPFIINSTTLVSNLNSDLLDSQEGSYYLDLNNATNQSAIDHGNISGLSDDDHSQYGLLIGRTGGQTYIGGTGVNDNLILQSTSDNASTSSYIKLLTGNNGAIEALTVNYLGNIGINETSPQKKLHITDNSGNCQLRVAYDGTHYGGLTSNSDGSLTIRTTDGISNGVLKLAHDATNDYLYLGTDDTQNGLIELYGQTSGNDGAEIRLHTSGNYDSVIDYFILQARQDDLRFGPITNPDALQYDGGTNKWEVTSSGGMDINSLSINSSTYTFPTSAGSEGQVLTLGSGNNVLWRDGGGGSSGGVSFTKNQPGHGFINDLTAVYIDTNGNLQAANALDVNKLGIFLISEINGDVLTYVQAGKIENITSMSLSAGYYYYVSDLVNGEITLTESTSGYSNPIFLADSSNSGFVLPFRASGINVPYNTGIPWNPISTDFSLDNGEYTVFGRFVVPTGKKLIIDYIGCIPDSGSSVTDLSCQIYSETGSTILTSTSLTYTFDGTEISAGTHITARINNDSGSTDIASAFVISRLINI